MAAKTMKQPASLVSLQAVSILGIALVLTALWFSLREFRLSNGAVRRIWVSWAGFLPMAWQLQTPSSQPARSGAPSAFVAQSAGIRKKALAAGHSLDTSEKTKPDTAATKSVTGQLASAARASSGGNGRRSKSCMFALEPLLEGLRHFSLVFDHHDPHASALHGNSGDAPAPLTIP